MTAQWANDVAYSYTFTDSFTATNTTINTTSGSVYPTAPNPQRAGYTLIGWNTPGGTPVVRGGYAFRWLANQTGADALVANWKANVYQINFSSANGGTYVSGGSNSQLVTAGANAINPPVLSKVGYEFAGWYAGSVGPVTSSYIPSVSCNSYYSSLCPVYLSAVWTPKSATIKYNANGGSGSAPSDQSYTSGTSVTLSANTFTPPVSPAGQSFLGWSLSTNGAIISSYNTPTNSATVNLYAIWSGSVLYTVTYDSWGGTGFRPITVTATTPITLPTPVRGGYRFNGWFTAGNSGGVRVGIAPAYTSYTPTRSILLIAGWVR
jgi:hypothetical protein